MSLDSILVEWCAWLLNNDNGTALWGMAALEADARKVHNSNCKSFSRRSNQRACPLASIPIRTLRVLSVL